MSLRLSLNFLALFQSWYFVLVRDELSFHKFVEDELEAFSDKLPHSSVANSALLGQFPDVSFGISLDFLLENPVKSPNHCLPFSCQSLIAPVSWKR